MGKKALIFIIVIVIIVGGIWWLSGRQATAPETPGGATPNTGTPVNATGNVDDAVNAILNDADDNAFSAANDPSLAADDKNALGNLGASLDTSGF